MSGSSFNVTEFTAHSSSVSTLLFGPRAMDILATGGDDCKVNVWRLDNDSNSATNATKIWSLGANKSSIKCLCFDNQARCIVSGSANGSIKVFDMNEGKLARNVGGHQVHITALQYHPYGEFIASGSIDCSVKLWDVRNKTCIQTYSGHEKEITCVRFSPDGGWVASSSKDGNLIIYDLVAGKQRQSIKMGGNAYPLIFEFNPVEYVLASCTSGRQVKLYDLDTMDTLTITPAESSQIKSISFSYDGNYLYTATKDYFRAWAWEPAFRMRTVLDSNWDKVQEIRVSSTNQLTGVGANGSNVTLWSLDLNNVNNNNSISNASNTTITPTKPSAAINRSGQNSNPSSSSTHTSSTPGKGQSISNKSASAKATPSAAPSKAYSNTSYNNDIPTDYYSPSPRITPSSEPTYSSLMNTNGTRKGSILRSTGHWQSESSSRDLASSMSDTLWRHYVAEQQLAKSTDEQAYTQLQQQEQQVKVGEQTRPESLSYPPNPPQPAVTTTSTTRDTPHNSDPNRLLLPDPTLHKSTPRKNDHRPTNSSDASAPTAPTTQPPQLHNEDIDIEIYMKEKKTPIIPAATSLVTQNNSSNSNNNNRNSNNVNNITPTYTGGVGVGVSLNNGGLSQQEQQQSSNRRSSLRDSKADRDQLVINSKLSELKLNEQQRPLRSQPTATSTNNSSNARDNNYNNSGNGSRRPPYSNNAAAGAKPDPVTAYQSNLLIPDYPSFDSGHNSDPPYDDYANIKQSNIQPQQVITYSTYINNRRSSLDSNITPIPISNGHNYDPSTAVKKSYDNIYTKNTRDNNIKIADDLTNHIINTSTSYISTIHTRTISIRMLRKLYLKKEYIDMYEYINVLYESSRLDCTQLVSLADFFGHVSYKIIPLTLQYCVQLSSIIEYMLCNNSNSNEYIHEIACYTLLNILQPFAQLIYDTRSTNTASMVNNRFRDVSKEDRIEKCELCYTIYIRIKHKIDIIRKIYKKNMKLQYILIQLIPLLDLATA